jgi:hypothetical protein
MGSPVKANPSLEEKSDSTDGTSQEVSGKTPPHASLSDSQMNSMFDSLSLDQKLAMLKLYQESEEKKSMQTKVSTAPVNYVRVEVPSLPIFSGEGKGHASYTLWRYELKCLIDNPELSQTSIWQAVRKSVKGLASEVLMHLGGKSSLQELVNKYDVHFGNTLSLEQLLQDFGKTEQTVDQSITSWGCQLEDLIQEIKTKSTFLPDTLADMLRSKFWSGLRSQHLKEALRPSFDQKFSYEDLVKKARTIETETEKLPLACTNKKVQSSQQAVTDSNKLDEILRQLRALDGRVQKIENQKSRPELNSKSERHVLKKPSHEKRVRPFQGQKGVCWECGDPQHKYWQCQSQQLKE